MNKAGASKHLPGDWKIRSLGEVAFRVTRRNNVGNKNVLTISARDGLVDQEEFFNKRIASADLSPYFLLTRGDFAYNKSYSSGYPAGVIRRLDRYERGVVSPLYICFRPNPQFMDSDYLAQYFQSGLMDDDIAWIAKEGARNHGLLNVGINDLLSIPIPMPSLGEQQYIATVLDTADEVIRSTERLITKLELIKRGLMSDLLGKALGSQPSFTIGEISSTYSGGTPSRGVPGFYGGEIPWVKSGEVNQTSISETEETITQAALRASSTRWVPAGVPLIAMYGATAGAVSWTKIRVTTNQAVLAVLPRVDRAQPRWLYWSLRQATPRILASVQGSGQPNISKRIIDDLALSIPPFVEQARTAVVLDSHQSMLDSNKAILQKLKAEKQGLMSDLLTGHVRIPPKAAL